MARPPDSSAAAGGAVLLRIPNWLGDLVLALPVIEAVAAHPDPPAILVGPGPFAAILTARYPHVRYHAVSRGARYALAGALRRERPETALLLTESFSSALLAFLAGARERIGFAAEGRGLLLTRRVARPRPARSTPRAAEYRILARAAGIALTDEPPRLEATPGEREAASELIRRSAAATGRYAVIAPGASYGPAKRWASERFAALARHWTGARGLTTVLVGSTADRDATGEVSRAAGGGTLDLAGRTDLGALIGVLAGAAVVGSNDSGVMHLAAALRRPTVAVFGSTSPVWTSAGAPWVRNLYAAYPCSPCFRRTCPIGYGCLEAVGAADAIRAADALLEDRRGAGRSVGTAG